MSSPHQVLAATLNLSQPGGGQIMPTLYWCPHQVLKATGAHVNYIIPTQYYKPSRIFRPCDGPGKFKGAAQSDASLLQIQNISIFTYQHILTWTILHAKSDRYLYELVSKLTSSELFLELFFHTEVSVLSPDHCSLPAKTTYFVCRLESS